MHASSTHSLHNVPVHLLCQSCGAALQLDAGVRTAVCPYCESPHVVERPPAPDRPEPAFAIGFRIPRDEAHQRVRRWLKGRTLFARSGVHKAKLDEVRGVYTPAYLYGAVAHTEYRAEIGEHYYVSVSSGSGKNQSSRRERRTEWLPLSGQVSQYVTDRIVTASRGVPNDELEKVEPFDLRLLARYRADVVSGWIAEDASLSAEHCAQLARTEAEQEVGRRLSTFLPGDEHRETKHRTRLEQESLDLILVPLWVFAARFGKANEAMRILVNGQTGATYGKVPLSWVKITLASLAAISLVVGAVLFFQARGRL